MKQTIINQIRELIKSKQEARILPEVPNERELKKALYDRIEEELDELIQEGHIRVVGKTINKQRMLKV